MRLSIGGGGGAVGAVSWGGLGARLREIGILGDVMGVGYTGAVLVRLVGYFVRCGGFRVEAPRLS